MGKMLGGDLKDKKMKFRVLRLSNQKAQMTSIFFWYDCKEGKVNVY